MLIQYLALIELGVIPREEIARVKTLEGMLQGHLDMDRAPGLEAVTGSLGQGLSIGVGMALALRLDRRPSKVWVIMGDGELSEGQLWEAAMAASAYCLEQLIGIVDRKCIQATGPTTEVLAIPDVERKWEAFGWRVLTVDGHDVSAVLAALDAAAEPTGRPTVIVADTVKGKGGPFAENTAAFHNGIMTREQYDAALARKNPDVVALEADLGKSSRSILLKEQFPEQDMASTAAGLALAGKIPFMHSFVVFASGRTYDQLRNSVCIPNLRVRVCGSSAGLSDFGDGKIHQALEDMAIMRALPNMN